MADPNRSKRQRHGDAVKALRNVIGHGTSMAAIADIIKTLRTSNVKAEDVTTSVLSKAAHDRAKALATTIVMPRISGPDWAWTLMSPNRLMQEQVAESEFLQSIMATAVRLHPPSLARPWHMVVAYDEFVPGNKLKLDNARKSMVLSFSFSEFGQRLTTEKAWFALAALR